MFPVSSFMCWSNSPRGRVYAEKHQSVDAMVPGKDSQGFCHGTVMSVAAPQKEGADKQKPADYREKRMSPQHTEGDPVVRKEPAFYKGIPDWHGLMTVITPASQEKPADHRDLLERGERVTAERAVASAGDQRLIAADPVIRGSKISADNAAESHGAEKEYPKR